MPRETGNLLLIGVPFLEPLAKGVVLLSAGALTTAFVFNWAYFLMLNSTLLGTLVLSDHIETAIWCLPPILLLTSIVLGVGFIGSFVQSFYENLVAKAEARDHMVDALAEEALHLAKTATAKNAKPIQALFLKSRRTSLPTKS
jgi:hypothetical protein